MTHTMKGNATAFIADLLPGNFIECPIVSVYLLRNNYSDSTRWCLFPKQAAHDLFWLSLLKLHDNHHIFYLSSPFNSGKNEGRSLHQQS